VGLWRTGWLRPRRLFTVPTRDFVLVLVAPQRGNQLVRRYQNHGTLVSAMPHRQLLVGLPRHPFLGELSYTDLIAILRKQIRWFSRSERSEIEVLTSYLQLKASQIAEARLNRKRSGRQLVL